MVKPNTVAQKHRDRRFGKTMEYLKNIKTERKRKIAWKPYKLRVLVRHSNADNRLSATSVIESIIV